MIAVWGAEEVLCREKSGSSLSWILCKELIESTYPCRGFIGFPVSLVNRVLCSDEPTRLCLATRNVWASSFFYRLRPRKGLRAMSLFLWGLTPDLEEVPKSVGRGLFANTASTPPLNTVSSKYCPISSWHLEMASARAPLRCPASSSCKERLSCWPECRPEFSSCTNLKSSKFSRVCLLCVSIPAPSIVGISL